MSKIATIPSIHRWRSFLEHEAIRIFGGLAGSTRNKVRQKLMADHALRGIPRQVAENDVADAMDFLEGRIALYGAAKATNPLPARRGRTGP